MSISGRSACDKTIRRLIERVERRLFYAGNLSPTKEELLANFPATQASMPEYYQLERFSDREEYHARLQVYINAKAVFAEWDTRAGQRGQLSRVTLNLPSVAADLLEKDLSWRTASLAIEKLQSINATGIPSVNKIIEGWKHGKSPGGVPAQKAEQFIDAVSVIKASIRERAHEKDVLLRRLSVQLFDDSKRIESLARPLAFLLDDNQGCEGESVFASLGLVKHPQPMLMSGPSICTVNIKEQLIQLTRPYLGFRPDTLSGVELNGESIDIIMTIENLASFNEAAEDNLNPDNLLLIYVAGNPTPSLLDAYGRIIQSVSPKSVMHWGDIDVGGFRIAARLAERAKSLGLDLHLWKMNAAEICSGKGDDDKENSTKIEEIIRICEIHNWETELAGIKQYPFFKEQEFTEWEVPG